MSCHSQFKAEAFCDIEFTIADNGSSASEQWGHMMSRKADRLEIRNPKSEIRNPKSEIRNPKAEIPQGGTNVEIRRMYTVCGLVRVSSRSAGFRPSDFGLRISATG